MESLLVASAAGDPEKRVTQAKARVRFQPR
jgi:hypothetical protein